METLDPARGDTPARTVLAAAAWLPFAYALVAGNLFPALLGARALGLALTPSFHDQQRILQIVALLILVGVVPVSRTVRTALQDAFGALPRIARWGLGLVAALGVVSSAGAVQPSSALREVGLFVLLALLGLVVAGARRALGPALEAGLLRLIVTGAGIYVMVFAIVDLSVDRTMQMPGFSHPRFFGQVALWVFPLLVAAALGTTGRPAVRLGRWGVAVAWWALLLESGSRAALLGSLLGIAAAAVARRREAWSWCRSSLAVVVGGSVTWVAWTRFLGAGAGGVDRMVAEATTDKGRLIIWREALRLAASDPVLGLGPEHYAYYAERPEGHPHSAPVQLLAEWGLPATVVMAALAGWGLWRLVRRDDGPDADGPRRGAVSGALVAAVVAGGAASLVDGVVVMPVSQMLLVGVVGWALGAHLAGRPPPTRRRATGQVVVAALAVAAATALVHGALPWALQPGHELRTYMQAHPDKPLTPRFWQVGRLDR